VGGEILVEADKWRSNPDPERPDLQRKPCSG
jgi:hypothetical protein